MVKAIVTMLLATAAFSASAKWAYETERDEMRGEVIRVATAMSANTETMNFSKNVNGYIYVVINSGGVHVLLGVDEGEGFNCMMGCQVSIKLDDGQIRQFAAQSPGNVIIDAVKVSVDEAFVATLTKAKRAIWEAPFVGSGSRQFKFEVAGLRFPK